MKKLFKTVFFISLSLILSFAFFMVVSAFADMNINSGSVGIIGGADGPTAIYITLSLIFENPVFWLLCAAVIVLIASAIGWIATRNK